MTNCIAHRGFSAHYPENTMLAFREAVKAGCHGIELDVHLTSDGEIVILHDETLERTTDGKGAVHSHSLQELRSLNASGPLKEKFGFQPIPTLREYFEFVRDLPIFTNIELKNSEYYYEGLEEKTIRMIREFGLQDRILFSSFNHASILLCRQLAPEIPGGFLCVSPVENCAAYARSCNIQAIHPEYGHISDEELAACIHSGISVNIWTVNDPLSMRQLIQKRVSGIITNDPELCISLLREQDSL